MIEPPRPQGGTKERERWEYKVSKLLRSETYGIDDLAALVANAETADKPDIKAKLEVLEKVLPNDRGSQIKRLENRVSDLEKMIAVLIGDSERINLIASKIEHIEKGAV